MSDSIVKFQDQVPMSPERLLEIIRDALIAHQDELAIAPYRLDTAETDDDGNLHIVLVGPAGPDGFIIYWDGIETGVIE